MAKKETINGGGAQFQIIKLIHQENLHLIGLHVQQGSLYHHIRYQHRHKPLQVQSMSLLPNLQVLVKQMLVQMELVKSLTFTVSMPIQLQAIILTPKAIIPRLQEIVLMQKAPSPMLKVIVLMQKATATLLQAIILTLKAPTPMLLIPTSMLKANSMFLTLVPLKIYRLVILQVLELLLLTVRMLMR